MCSLFWHYSSKRFLRVFCFCVIVQFINVSIVPLSLDTKSTETEVKEEKEVILPETQKIEEVSTTKIYKNCWNK